MISTKPISMVAMLAVAGVAAAQEKVDEQRIGELIEQLTDDETRSDASNRLVAIGKLASERLLNVVEEVEEHPAKREVLFTLARMRLQANEIVRGLLRVQVDRVSLEVLPAFCRALGNLTPYATLDWDELTHVENVISFIHVMDRISREIPSNSRTGFLREFSDEAFRLQGRVALIKPLDKRVITVGPAQREVKDLIRALVEGRLPAMERELNHFLAPTADGSILSAELLGHRSSEARPALPALREFLLATVPTEDLPVNPDTEHHEDCLWLAIRVPADKLAELASQIARGEGASPTTVRRVPFGLEVKTAVAVAMEKIAPGDPVIAVAVAYRLLHHSDASDREDAARTLGGFGKDAADAVPLLVEALKSNKTLALGEAITVLGMIGPAAKDAIPTLEKLAEHEDPQIAERAKAALRQVRAK